MSSEGPAGMHPLLTVLYIGRDAAAPNLEQLRYEGIGVVAVHSIARGLAVLKSFCVAAVICDVPDLLSVTTLTETRTPVILLAGEDADWGGPEVKVVSRRTSSATLAQHVRQLARTTADRAKQNAA